MTEETIIIKFLERHGDEIHTILWEEPIYSFLENNCSRIDTQYGTFYKVFNEWCKIKRKNNDSKIQ